MKAVHSGALWDLLSSVFTKEHKDVYLQSHRCACPPSTLIGVSLVYFGLA